MEKKRAKPRPIKVLFSGDTHGEFDHLSGAIGRLAPDAVVVAGDFGFWHEADLIEGGSESEFLHASLKHPGCKVYFCDGNHENHALLQALVAKKGWEKPISVSPGLAYCPRGSALTVRSRRILFMGGAYSIDRAYRVQGKSWFPEEEITEEDILRALSRKNLAEFDTVVSHTCPAACLPAVCREAGIDPAWVKNDRSERLLQRLFEAMLGVRDWYFGHWHCALDFEVKGRKTHFHLLNMSPSDRALQGWGWRQQTIDAAADAVSVSLQDADLELMEAELEARRR